MLRIDDDVTVLRRNRAWDPKGETRTAQNPRITEFRKLTRRRLGSPIRRQRRGVAHFDRIVGDVNGKCNEVVRRILASNVNELFELR